MLRQKDAKRLSEENTFEWKGDLGVGDPTPYLGVALGLKFIREAIYTAGNDYICLWDDKQKCFLVIKNEILGRGKRGPVASAIIFSDFELLQTASPELLADTFETRVKNAIMTLQQSAFGKNVKKGRLDTSGRKLQFIEGS
jgi:hypothetical protein